MSIKQSDYPFQIWLPWPTSTNKLYAPRPGAKYTKRLSDQYQRWKDHDAREAWLQQRNGLPRFKMKVCAAGLYAHSRRVRKDGKVRENAPDLDNHWKAIGDFLQAVGAIQNDKDIMAQSFEWTNQIDDGVLVLLKPYGGGLL